VCAPLPSPCKIARPRPEIKMAACLSSTSLTTRLRFGYVAGSAVMVLAALVLLLPYCAVAAARSRGGSRPQLVSPTAAVATVATLRAPVQLLKPKPRPRLKQRDASPENLPSKNLDRPTL